MTEKLKTRLLYALMALTMVPFLFVVHSPTSWGVDGASLKSVALYFSSVFGYMGVSLLVWELILGTRSISGLYFSNLPALLGLHRRLGTYGSLVFLLHPLLVLVAYSESILYLFSPTLHGEYDTAVTYGKLAFWALIVVWVTSAVVRGSIKYRPWKYVHYLSYPVLLLTFLHVPNTGHSFTQSWVQFYWYSVVGIALMCLSIRASHIFGYGKVEYKILSTQQMSDDVYLLKLQARQKNLSIAPGQYVYLQTSLWGEEHPFTVLDATATTGEILIAFKVFGTFTKALAARPPEWLYVDGPYGTFTTEVAIQPAQPTVYIAGGIGVTPFAKHVLLRHNDNSYMFYANQTHKTAVLRDSLRGSLGVRYIDIFSRETGLPVVAESNVEHGHINADIIAKYVTAPTNYRYYICGPAAMINTARQALTTLGVSPSAIHSEEFGF